MERLHQVILNMLVTKYIDIKVFDYIDPWSETLASIAWVRKASYHRTIMTMSVVDWLVATTAKQRQVDIDNVRGNAKQVMHDYAIGD